LSQLSLEKSSLINSHKAVLGSPTEGLFSCFSFNEGLLLLNTECK